MKTPANPTILELHSLLVQRHHDLAEELGNEGNPEKAAEITEQMQQLLIRVNATQQALLRTDLGELREEMEAVRAASQELRLCLKSLRNLNRALETSAHFVKVVDRILSLAKP